MTSGSFTNNDPNSSIYSPYYSPISGLMSTLMGTPSSNGTDGNAPSNPTTMGNLLRTLLGNSTIAN
jgi:hypothetical protein